MSALSLGLVVSLDSRSGVHVDLSSHDKTILVELSDVLSGVSHGYFTGLIGVDPNSLLSAFKDGSSKSLLKSEECHI
jgi:hypothetical protein